MSSKLCRPDLRALLGVDDRLLGIVCALFDIWARRTSPNRSSASAVNHDERGSRRLRAGSDAPIADGFASRLRVRGLFQDYLMPDDNADHHDHVHVGVSPLPEEVM
ncbi:MAG: hypothetical protein ABW061_28265 [Polyangiaceae bacterium]